MYPVFRNFLAKRVRKNHDVGGQPEMKLEKQCRNMEMRGCLKEPLRNGYGVASGNSSSLSGPSL